MTALAFARDKRYVGVVMAVLFSGLLVASLVMRTSAAGFSATTNNGANSWQTGTVVLTDNDSGAALFSSAMLDGGQAVTKCINVTYSGTFTSGTIVKMFTSSVSGALAPYLDVVVDGGTGATDTNCTGFTTDGGGNIFSGTLSAFGTSATSYATGVDAWAPTSTPVTKTYRIVATVQNDNNAQGKTAAATFNWEAQHN